MKIKRFFASIITILLIGAIANSVVVLFLLGRMKADARVVNQAGIVRGAMQRLVKMELQGEPSNSLKDTVDTKIDGLLNGSAALNLPKPSDAEFMAQLQQVQGSWNDLKAAIDRYRADGISPKALYELSEKIYAEADQAVRIAEHFSQRKVTTAYVVQIAISIVNLLVIAAIIFANRRIANTLANLISTLANTSSQLTATMQMHERVASEQATATNQTTTTIEHVGDSSRMSAAQAESSSNETHKAILLAEEGNRVVQQTLDSMRELKANVENLAREIMFLSERLDQIAEISAFVGDLANQTNMLALNAAVEAAHAGDQGKGFAVVASEIRKLADQSTKSVSRINDLVTDIQQATNSAVMVTDQGTKVVEHGMSLAEGTTQVFKNLVSSINRGAESVQQISLNAKQQASAINQIVEAIELLDTGAKEAAQGLRQTNTDLQTLNRVVVDLQDMVGVNNDHRR